MRTDLVNNSIYELQTLGFDGFRSVKDLQAGCHGIPGGKGIYLVLYVRRQRPVFLEKGPGGFFKGRDPNVSTSELRTKWIDDTVIVYIGQTGDSLKGRISKLIQFGQGMPVAHHGGRHIWQIQDYMDLIVCWKSCPEGIDAREIEHELLGRFRARHGKLPFANRQT